MEWLLLLKRYWHFGVIFLLGLAVIHLNGRAEHWHSQTVACGQARESDRDEFKATATAASDKNKTEVAAVEHNWQQVVADKDKEYHDAITNSNAAVASYVDRMRKANLAASSGKSGTGGVPKASDPASLSDGTGEAAVISVPVGDLSICAENTVKAQTWQDFWKSVKDGAEIKTP